MNAPVNPAVLRRFSLGQTWRTERGHKVKIIAIALGPDCDHPAICPISVAYVDGRVDGMLGTVFSMAGASREGDKLVELIAEYAPP